MRLTSAAALAALTFYGVALGALDAIGRRLFTPR
jgi:hypothetical protein